MIKRLIYILLFLPLAVSSQYNFFYSHASCHLCYLYKDDPQYLGGYTNYDISFNTDGTKMYALGGEARSTIYQYSLSTAWNIRSATYSTAFGTGNQEIYPHGIFFKPDGTKLYVVGSNNDIVYQYSLTTAWNVGTANYDSIYYDISGQEIIPTALYFNSDGSKFFIVGQDSKTVYAYTMVTNWDVSTANYGSESYSISSEETYPHSLFFSSDGLCMYVQGLSSDKIHRYSLSTAWTLPDPWNGETVTLVDSYTITKDETQGLFIKPDWTKVYTVGVGNVCAYYFKEIEIINLKDGLVSLWEFDETSGTTATDAHGSNDGTVTGATINQTGTGNLSKAYSFDGNGDYVQVTHSSTLAITGNISISAWVYLDSYTNYNGIISKCNTNIAYPYDVYTVVTTGKLRFWMGNGNSANDDYWDSTDAIPLTTWTHIVITRESGTVKMYINGSLDSTDTGFSATTADGGDDLYIGNRIDSGTDLAGDIAQIGIWNKVLSVDEISALYNSGNGKAYSTW